MSRKVLSHCELCVNAILRYGNTGARIIDVHWHLNKRRRSWQNKFSINQIRYAMNILRKKDVFNYRLGIYYPARFCYIRWRTVKDPTWMLLR